MSKNSSLQNQSHRRCASFIVTSAQAKTNAVIERFAVGWCDELHACSTSRVCCVYVC